MMMVVMIMGLMVHQSMGLKSSHPMHDVVDKINKRNGPYIGLVLAFPAEELPLIDSGLFVHNSIFPFVYLSGRKFNIGKIQGIDVIYVITGEQTVNAALTVEILVQAFDVKGVVHYGIAGSTNTSLTVGDVSVPDYVAFTNSWKWKEFGSTDQSPHELKVGAYNLPLGGENQLSEIQFTPVQVFFNNGKPMKELFWLPVDPLWFNIATKLKTSLSNGVPCIVIRGVSDVAGGDKLALAGLSALATINAFKVAIKFIEQVANTNITF